MKLSVILVSFLVAFISLNQSFAEVYTTGSAADNNGNIIVIGYCLGNVAIGGEQFSITTPSAFILKLNSDGGKIWVRFINSSESIKANAVAVDSSGNIYITGEFSGTANFAFNSLTAQNVDAFIVKLNVDGEFEWVKQGRSINSATGNDIFVKDNFVYVCGDGKPITFDSLSIAGGGFTVIYNIEGNIINLFKSRDSAYRLSLDASYDILILGGEYNLYPIPHYVISVSKYSIFGSFFWAQWYDFSGCVSICLDNNRNIYTAGDNMTLVKQNENGNTINYNFFSGSGSRLSRDITLKNDYQLLVCGYFSLDVHFGDSTFQSNGSTDFFIAVVDTNLEPVWLKHGGGSYNDELNSIIQLNDGNIVCSGNFKGTISVDSLVVTGGNSADANWVGIAKYDSVGNLLWVKKVVEQFTPPSVLNWFPLEIGSKFQYFGSYSIAEYYPKCDYLIHFFHVTDTVWVNNKKYFSVNGFGTGNLIFRYDAATQRIMALYQNQEYLYMDFSKLPGETFFQIQNDGNFKNTTVISKTLFTLGDSVITKGFHNQVRIYGTMSYSDLATMRYFAPEIGWVMQEEEWIGGIPIHETDFSLIEYLTNYENQLTHKKHSETATLSFDPVTFIPDGDSLYQPLTILHPFSKQNIPASRGFFSYMTGTMQSFYFNGTDTIWNSNFNISQIDSINFYLNYQFDTTKYSQGYHLYYRIAAVDKGIIADTFYSPQTGYYKLFWKDSTTSVIQTEFEALTYSLSQNYPNPFNPVSKIVFTIPKRENVSLKVYDILGSEITTLVNKELDAGKYEIDFSGKNLSSGIYIYQIKAGAFRETKKMILMR